MRGQTTTWRPFRQTFSQRSRVQFATKAKHEHKKLAHRTKDKLTISAGATFCWGRPLAFSPLKDLGTPRDHRFRIFSLRPASHRSTGQLRCEALTSSCSKKHLFCGQIKFGISGTLNQRLAKLPSATIVPGSYFESRGKALD